MAPSSNPLALAASLEPTVGAYFLGAITSVGLSGITTLQSWLYFQKYPQDPVVYKLLVAFIWTLEILRSCISIHGGYYYSVQNWGNIMAFTEPVWSMKVMVLLTTLAELAVHCFFIHKVWKATHAKVLCCIITLFVIGDFALGLVAYITATLETDFIEILQGTPEHAAIGALSCAIGADWLITFALVRFFRENKTQFHKTDRLLNELIFYAINMGLLISLTDAVVLVLSVISWSTINFYQLTVYEVVGNLYANSLLACLNARGMALKEPKPPPPSSNNSSSRSVDTLNHTVQIYQQTWISSEVTYIIHSWALSPNLRPQATIFTLSVSAQPADAIRKAFKYTLKPVCKKNRDYRVVFW